MYYLVWSTHQHLSADRISGRIDKRRIGTSTLTWRVTEMRDAIILHTKTIAVQNDVALSYHSVRGLYFLGVAVAAIIITVHHLELIGGFMKHTH